MYAISEFICGALTDRLFLRLTPKTKQQPNANSADAAINAAGRRRFLPLVVLAFLLCAPHPAHAACASPAGVEGQIVYNGSYHVLQYCDNLNVWNAMGQNPGSGGAGCSGPSGVEGQLMYNESYHILQYCDGTNWRPATSSPVSYNTGIVGWWKFDDGSSGTTPTTAADSSGNGNTGTLVNAPTWTTSGKINDALFFNGTSQDVSIPDSASLEPGNNYTIAAWVNAASLSGSSTNTILEKPYATTHQSFHIFFNPSFGFFNDNGSTTGYLNSWITPAIGTWHYYAAVVSGSTVTLYIDGSQVAQSTTFPATTAYDATPVGIGADPGAEYCNCTIDDVRIWNRALSASEVQALYDATAGQDYTTGLVGWWKLDDGSSGTTPLTATDSSGNGNTGTLTNGPTWTTGKIGNALTFNGTSQYVSVPAAALPSDNTFTASLWFKTTASGVLMSEQDAAVGGTPTHFDPFLYVETTGVLHGGIFAGTTPSLVTSAAVNDGNWHNAALVVNSFQTLYVDGALIGTFSGAPEGPYAYVYLGTGYAGGAWPNTNNSWFYFNGTIDDVRIYNRALSAVDIAGLYQYSGTTIIPPAGCAPTGLVGWWKMDEGTGTTTADSSGGGNTGTLVAAPTWTTGGKINDALTFNGTSQYVSVPDVASLRLSSAWTASAWVKVSALPASGAVAKILTRDDGAGNSSYALSLDNGDICSSAAWLVSFDDAGGTIHPVCYLTTITTGAWYHLVGTWDGTTLTMYVNGVPTAANVPGALPTSNTGGALEIANEYTNTWYFNGTVDDVRVYNRTLSASEVRDLYNGISGGVEGQLMYNATSHVPQFCDGTAWRATK